MRIEQHIMDLGTEYCHAGVGGCLWLCTGCSHEGRVDVVIAIDCLLSARCLVAEGEGWGGGAAGRLDERIPLPRGASGFFRGETRRLHACLCLLREMRRCDTGSRIFFSRNISRCVCFRYIYIAVEYTLGCTTMERC